MNFLAHSILAGPDASPEFHLGALFPDIARRAGFKLQPSGLPSSLHIDVQQGMLLHWKADALFHNSELFQVSCQWWKAELAAINSNFNRMFFLYHLLAEMWLDRILMQHLPHSTQMLYQQLDLLSEEILLEMSHKFNDPDQKILSALKEFKNRKFILDYEYPEKFAAIGSGVFFRISQQEFQQDLAPGIELILNRLRRYEPELLQHWQQFSSSLLLENSQN